MRGGNLADVQAREESVAVVAGLRLNVPRMDVRGVLDEAFDVVPCGEFFDKSRVGAGFIPTQPVIVVRN